MPPEDSKPRLRLGRAVLIALLIVGAAGAIYLGRDPWRARHEGASRDALKDLGALVVMNSNGQHVFSANLSLPAVRDKLDEALPFVPDLVYLELIDLSRTTISDEQLASVAKLGNLTAITLNHTQIGDAGLTHLTGLGNLTALYLGETNVSAKGLTHISRLPNLKILDLSKTKVDGDLSGLSKAISLQWVLLNGMDVSDEAIDSLARLPILRRLSLRGSQVSNEAIERLKTAKPNIKIDQ